MQSLLLQSFADATHFPPKRRVAGLPAPWAVCLLTPNRTTFSRGLGQQQLPGNLHAAAVLPELIVLMYWLLVYLRTFKYVLLFSFPTHNTQRRKTSPKKSYQNNLSGLSWVDGIF